jgi:hypothetical protein
LLADLFFVSHPQLESLLDFALRDFLTFSYGRRASEWFHENTAKLYLRYMSMGHGWATGRD